MSQYSDFFGVASSGGGLGLPPNSPVPFYTSSATPGLNQQSGLYTHPSGEFFLATGKTIVDTPGNYPAATGTWNSNTYSGFQFATSPTAPANKTTVNVFNGTYLYVGPYTAMVEYDYATGTPTGNTKSVANPAANLSYYWTSDEYVGVSGNTVYSYNSSFQATGFSFTFSHTQTVQPYSGRLSYGPKAGSYFCQGQYNYNAQIVEYNGSGQGTGYSFTGSPTWSGTTPVGGINTDGSWITTWGSGYPGGNSYFQPDTGAKISGFVGQTLSNVAFTENTGGTNSTLNFLGRTPNIVNWYRSSGNVRSTVPVLQVGDSTARTDTDTTYPIFLKLK